MPDDIQHNRTNAVSRTPIKNGISVMNVNSKLVTSVTTPLPRLGTSNFNKNATREKNNSEQKRQQLLRGSIALPRYVVNAFSSKPSSKNNRFQKASSNYFPKLPVLDVSARIRHLKQFWQGIPLHDSAVQSSPGVDDWAINSNNISQPQNDSIVGHSFLPFSDESMVNTDESRQISKATATFVEAVRLGDRSTKVRRRMMRQLKRRENARRFLTMRLTGQSFEIDQSDENNTGTNNKSATTIERIEKITESLETIEKEGVVEITSRIELLQTTTTSIPPENQQQQPSHETPMVPLGSTTSPVCENNNEFVESETKMLSFVTNQLYDPNQEVLTDRVQEVIENMAFSSDTPR